MAFHIPKRSLRSCLFLILVVLGPYILVRHLALLSDRRDSYAGRRWEYEITDDRPVGEGWDEDEDGWLEGRGGGGREERDPGYFADEDDFDSQPEVPRLARPGQPAQHAQHAGSPSRQSHTYLPNGLLLPNPAAPHPIHDLIARGHAAWEAKLARASKTLAQAVDEYRRRYERNPPRGFERWWKYVEEHGVQLPDEYDQIHRDLEPFHGLPPKELARLLNTVSAHSGMYTITCPGITHTKLHPHKVGSNKAKLRRPSARCTYEIVEKGLNEEGKRVARERAKAQVELLEGVEDLLEEVKVVYYSHDVPWQFVGHEYKGALEDAASVGEFFKSDEHDHDLAHLGWASACAPHKPLRETYNPDALPDLDALWIGDKSFIWDHKATMDPCTHPTLTHLVGFLSGHGKGPGPSSELYPVLAMCKTTLHADVLAVSMEAWTEDVGDDPAWAEKDDRMLWRGKTTGIYFKDGVPWNISQRINLVHQTSQTSGSLPLLPASPATTPVGAAQDSPLADLNAKLMDVAFVDEAIQCDEAVCKEVQKGYKFGSRKNWAEGNGYKYLLDIDGNGWSARFKRLMTTSSVVLKSTIFPEWYTDRLQPWVHYVPLKPSLTDLYDVLSFFRAHDAQAEAIGAAGKEWSKTFWRREDMVAYQFRLMLELARVMSPDREAASFHLRGEDLK
ncbi:hypothetical protein IAT38_004895 [Cryptococcus sp. DSM 104549]